MNKNVYLWFYLQRSKYKKFGFIIPTTLHVNEQEEGNTDNYTLCFSFTTFVGVDDAHGMLWIPNNYYM